MNWMNWYLNQDDMNNYFFRFAFILIMVMLFDRVPGPGNILFLLILFDVIFWFAHKKPKLKKMEDD